MARRKLLLIAVALLVAGAVRAEPGLGRARAVAVRRAVGAALLSLGVVMIPTSTAWYLSADARGCPAPCAPSDQDRAEAAERAFAGWHGASHALALGGGTLLVHAQRTRDEGGPTHPAARGLRIFGGVLVAASAVILPLGLLLLDNDLGGKQDERARVDGGVGMLSVGTGLLLGGLAMVTAGAYYDSPPSRVAIGASPLLRADAGARFLGAIVTVSGSF